MRQSNDSEAIEKPRPFKQNMKYSLSSCCHKDRSAEMRSAENFFQNPLEIKKKKRIKHSLKAKFHE